MFARLSAMATIVAAGALAAGGAVGQQSWLTVGPDVVEAIVAGATAGGVASGTTWHQVFDDYGNSSVIVTDSNGRTRRYVCPPGRDITVVQTTTGGGVAESMSSHVGVSGLSSSVTVGGGGASAVTVLNSITGSGVAAGSGGHSRVTVICR